MQRLGVKTRLKNTLGELIKLVLSVTPGDREERDSGTGEVSVSSQSTRLG